MSLYLTSVSVSLSVRTSAFDTTRDSQILSVQPLIEAAAGGISTAVLIYESFPKNSSTRRDVLPYAKQAAIKIKNILSSFTDMDKVKSLKYRKNRKVDGVLLANNPVPIVIIYDVIACLNFGELNSYLLDIVLKRGNVDVAGGQYQ